jgi:16S rRNA (uracil1498-N3)-methyltransferase
MRNPRIYQAQAFEIGQTQVLNDDAFGHIVRVLRLKDGDDITLFNGIAEQENYFEYQARLCNVNKKSANVEIITKKIVANESPLNIHLAQGISRGERMDFTR